MGLNSTELQQNSTQSGVAPRAHLIRLSSIIRAPSVRRVLSRGTLAVVFGSIAAGSMVGVMLYFQGEQTRAEQGQGTLAQDLHVVQEELNMVRQQRDQLSRESADNLAALDETKVSLAKAHADLQETRAMLQQAQQRISAQTREIDALRGCVRSFSPILAALQNGWVFPSALLAGASGSCGSAMKAVD